MPTPNFNKELLKLRRRLGDLRTEDGVDITETTIGTLNGNVWRVSELVDTYNDAVRDFLDYIVTSVPQEVWYAYIPGFIRNTTKSTTDGYIHFEDITPSPFFFINVNDSTAEIDFTPIPVGEYAATRQDKFPKRHPSENELYYTIFAVDGGSMSIVLIPSNSYSTVEIAYIKQYVDIIVDGDVEFEGITGTGLRKIIDFAEAEAYKQKQAIAPEFMQKMIDLKTKIAASNVGSQ